MAQMPEITYRFYRRIFKSFMPFKIPFINKYDNLMSTRTNEKAKEK